MLCYGAFSEQTEATTTKSFSTKGVKLKMVVKNNAVFKIGHARLQAKSASSQTIFWIICLVYRILGSLPYYPPIAFASVCQCHLCRSVDGSVISFSLQRRKPPITIYRRSLINTRRPFLPQGQVTVTKDESTLFLSPNGSAHLHWDGSEDYCANSRSKVDGDLAENSSEADPNDHLRRDGNHSVVSRYT